MRKSVGTSRTKPHSMPSPPLSALAQPRAMLDRKESFFSRASDEARYSGNRRSQGLKVKKSTGLRAIERTAIGASRLKAVTAAAAPQTIFARDRTAAVMPRSVRTIAVRAFRTTAKSSWGPSKYPTSAPGDKGYSVDFPMGRVVSRVGSATADRRFHHVQSADASGVPLP